MEELLQDVITYLGDDYDSRQENLLRLLIKNAVGEVLNRRYPFGYTEEQRDNAVQMYYNTIFDIAVYLYGKQGAEGQLSMSENGTSRSYESGGIPNSYLYGIVPVVKVC